MAHPNGRGNHAAGGALGMTGEINRKATALEIYREWGRVRAEWYRRADAGENWKGPKMSALRERRFEIEDQVGCETPHDPTGAALIAAILWTTDGPCTDSEEENLELAEADVSMRMKLRLKEWAETVLAPSQIMADFREWKRTDAAAKDLSISEQQCDALTDAACEIEGRMMATPAVTAQELAAKIVALTSDGTFNLDGKGADALWADIRRLANSPTDPAD